MIIPELVASSPFRRPEDFARNADGDPGTPNPRGAERFLSSKIHDCHLDRLAIVYVRQSTMAQVVEHRESAEMQYKLGYRATALGWPNHRVVVIDEDQGQSGSSAEHRLGFQRLMAEVSLRHVGIVLGIEMSRFARSNKDWHHLLELCGIFGTLLADQDGIYDPADYNDRLLLGLKGTMSEAELHILRNRLQHGKRNKAERGELFAHLPRGFVKSASGKVTLDPDEQVQSVIRLFFEKFEGLGSGRKLLRWLLAHDIRLPLRPARGPHLGELKWSRPSHGAVHKMLHHPIYAGAYSYGRCRIDHRANVPGRTGSGRVQLPMDQWQVLKQDHLPSYITWEQYLSNLKQLAQNAFRSETRGAARDGQALLGGVIRCGRCGRRMSVVYNDYRNAGRYVCHSAEPGSRCQGIQAREIDRLVEQQVLAALQPCALELSLKAANEIEAQRSHVDAQWRHRLERATYETQRARRQFNAVEPENRLVTRELEKCWEQALRNQQNVEEEYARFRQQVSTELNAVDRADIQALASSVPALWNAKTTRNEQRKAILRHLLDDVAVEVINDSEAVDVRITWVGGFTSQHQSRRSVQRYDQLQDYDRLRERMRELRGESRSASHIASQLNEEGFRTARGLLFQDVTVQTLLFRSDMTRDKDQLAELSSLPDHDRWSIPQLVQELNIPTTTLCHWCRRGWVHVAKTRSNRWLVWADAAELKRLRALSTHRRPQNRGTYPSELTTPRPLGNTGEQGPHKA